MVSSFVVPRVSGHRCFPHPVGFSLREIYPSETGDFETARFDFETWKAEEKGDTTGIRESTLLAVVYAPTIRRPTTNTWPGKVLKRETPEAT